MHKHIGRMLFLSSFLFAAADAHAQDATSGPSKSVADFYHENTVFMVIGSAPGGGFDYYARTIAKYMTKHVPGAPSVVPQNLPGSGGIAAGSRVAVTAPQDGTFIGAIHPTTIVDPVLGDPSKNTKPLNFAYLGSASNNVEACFMRTDAAAKSFDELFHKEVVFGASNRSSSSREYVSLLQNVLGMKITLVAGYKGSNEIMLALERGEVKGTCGAGYLNVLSSYPRWFDQDFVRLVSYQGDKPLGEAKELRFAKPTVSYAKTDEQRQILALYDLQEEFGRPYVTGAGVPRDRVAALRKAFMDTLNDPSFRGEIEARGLDVSPLSGEDLQKIVASIYDAPPDLLKKARQALGYE
jgi:tripartite-type tricarboxylate transporter receptor subunit TctC